MQGTLNCGVRPVWKLVRSCLEDQHCSEAVEDGQAALEMLQEEWSEMSEKASSERNHQKWGKLYPDLSELKESEGGYPESAESDKELQVLIKKNWRREN